MGDDYYYYSILSLTTNLVTHLMTSFDFLSTLIVGYSFFSIFGSRFATISATVIATTVIDALTAKKHVLETGEVWTAVMDVIV